MPSKLQDLVNVFILNIYAQSFCYTCRLVFGDQETFYAHIASTHKHQGEMPLSPNQNGEYIFRFTQTLEYQVDLRPQEHTSPITHSTHDTYLECKHTDTFACLHTNNMQIVCKSCQHRSQTLYLPYMEQSLISPMKTSDFIEIPARGYDDKWKFINKNLASVNRSNICVEEAIFQLLSPSTNIITFFFPRPENNAPLCIYCNFQTTTYGELFHHMRCAHMFQRGCECTECSFKGLHFTDITQHQLVHQKTSNFIYTTQKRNKDCLIFGNNIPPAWFKKHILIPSGQFSSKTTLLNLPLMPMQKPNPKELLELSLFY